MKLPDTCNYCGADIRDPVVGLTHLCNGLTAMYAAASARRCQEWEERQRQINAWRERKPLTEHEMIAGERAEWEAYREREEDRYTTEFAAKYN